MRDIATIAAARAPHLLDRIKLEVRWHLATHKHALGVEPIPPAAPDDRHHLVAAWPAIRNRRLPAHEIAARFYDIAATEGAALAALILARRERRRP